MARAERRRGAPLRVALTGGIACGKSTVARLFQALGAGLIDTDRIARELVDPGTPALAQVVAQFGPQLLTAQGTLDRAALRALVFADAHARARLEGILHPLIHAEVDRRSQRRPEPYLLVDIPLLAETGTAGRYDRVLVVDCPPQLQRLRLRQRDGIDDEAATRILAAQAPREARLALADDIIRNDGDVKQLARQVETLHKAYTCRRGHAK